MTTPKSTKTNKTAAKDTKPETAAATPDHDQTTPTTPDTVAETPAPEPAASPAHQPDVDTTTPAIKGDSDCQDTGYDPGPNMTEQDYDTLVGKHIGDSTREDSGWQSGWTDHNSIIRLSDAATLRAIPDGLSPKQHVSAIIAGGIIGGMLARTKPYETLDLHKAAETLGMCDTLVDMILRLDDPAPEAPDEQPNS